MSPRRCSQPMPPAARAALVRMAVSGGVLLRDERVRRGLTLDQVADRAGVGRSTVQRLEAGEPASLESYARISAALALRPELVMLDPTRRGHSQHRDEDLVHAAMGEVEARQLRGVGWAAAIDEPYQHFQFAGRADVVASDPGRRALLHVENRTRFPNLQEAAGSYNAKRAYFPAALAARLGLHGGWRSVSHALVVLWSAEAIHALRLRRSSFLSALPRSSRRVRRLVGRERAGARDHLDARDPRSPIRARAAAPVCRHGGTRPDRAPLPGLRRRRQHPDCRIFPMIGTGAAGSGG